MATHISVSGEESRRQYRFSCFLLDLDSGFLRRDGQEVPLRPKSFEVLTHLVLRHGKLVSRDDLVEAVWPNAAVTDNSLAQCLFEIRRALEDDRQTIVRTVARRGYVFDASVSVASNDGPPPLDKVPETASPSTSSSGIGGVAGVPPWTAPNDLADELHGARDNLPLRIDSRAPARVRRSLKALGLGIAALAGVGLVTAALSGLIGRVPPPETTVLELAAPDGQRFLGYPATLALSPDARQVVFSTVPAGTAVERMQRRGASGGSPLMIRALNLPTAQALKGTEGGTYPFWSPDGKRVGFLANAGADNGGVLRTVRLADGSVSAVADVALGRGAWSASGIVFTGSDGRLYQVSEDGGPPRPVTELDVSRGEYRHAWPTFLPDGRRFLYLALSIDERRVTSGLQPDSRSGVYLSSIDSPARTRLLDAVTSIEYAAGHLLYHRSGSLIAQRFDDGRAQLTGDAIPIVEAIAFSGFDGLMAASTSQSGVLVYQRGGHGLPQGTLTWFDRNGRKMNAITPPGDYRYATLSPGGRRVAVVYSADSRAFDVWQIDLERNVPTRLTFNNDDDFRPIAWSADGRYVAFPSPHARPRVWDLYRRLADGGTADELLFESPEGKTPTSFSPDGKLLLFTRYKARGQDADIWALPLDRHRDPFPVVETPFHEGSAVYSPDGRWIAYVSNDSGDRQVYVQPFAGPEPRIRLSTTSGTWPVWTRGGREIVYATIEQELMAVDITIDGQTIQASAPHKLFAQPYIGSYWNSFAVDASGERFLIAVPEEESSRTLTVVLNWPALLGAK